jgi:hypothetical protein
MAAQVHHEGLIIYAFQMSENHERIVELIISC